MAEPLASQPRAASASLEEPAGTIRISGSIRRADVATRLVPDARDLGDAIGAVPDDAWIDATAALLRALAAAGARHPDLNLKNVLLAADGAWVLDVDVVALGTPPEAAARANWARLERSLLKWRRERGLAIADAALAELARRVA